MRIRLIIAVLIGGFLTVLTSCEEDTPIPPEEKENPYELEVGWNGFKLDETDFETPNAIIEIWGENLDSLSSDFDINFTDGTFNPLIRDVYDYTVLVYFDVNSPLLSELGTGIYYFEQTTERKPNNIVEAYVQIRDSISIYKYPIIEGSVEVSEQEGFILIEYVLKTVKDQEIVDIVGQYTGAFEIIDQTID